MIVEVACPIPVLKNFDYVLPDALNDHDDSNLLGRRVNIPFGHKQSVGMICGLRPEPTAGVDQLKTVVNFVDEEPLLDEELIALAQWMSDRYLCSMGEALFAMLPRGKDKPKAFQAPVFSSHNDSHFGGPAVPTTHTADQENAIKIIHEGIYHHQTKSILLFGEAATGKTEVYMAAIADVLAQGRSTMVLVPEIGLALQTYQFLKDRFGETAVLLNSSEVSNRERVNNWWKIKRGEFPIVVGSRSNALAPMKNIGLIIVDEEQDYAFKEDRKPRFHARDVALERARQNNAVALFGSATPSLELMQGVKDGTVTCIELSERAIAASKPRVRLVNLREDRARGAVSRSLENAIQERAKAEEQTILFLNRRGFFRYLKCPECSWVARCPRCAIAVVYHKSDVFTTHQGEVVHDPSQKHHKKDGVYGCHYCSYIAPPILVCPECRHKKLFAGGYGTQRVAEELAARMPWVKVARWDRDSLAQKGTHQRVFQEFAAGQYDVLIGTQMVAQGFNFPGVTLVGVIDADSLLHLPDFRSAEKTFQLLTQVAGRAGRAMITGDVLIQTRNPDHYALTFAVQMDYKGFSEVELRFRSELYYPPFGHLVEVIIGARTPEKMQELIQKLLAYIDALDLALPVGVMGPSELREKNRKGYAQQRVMLKVRNEIWTDFLKRFRDFMAVEGAGYSVDVDPE